MNRQKPGSQKNIIKTETLKQRVATLFDELHLAAGWQRPSILVATYRSRLVLIEAQVALEKKLLKSHQSVYHLRVNEENYDIPVFLAQFPDRENTVFFVSGISPTDGKIGMNAFRALNIRREILVDYSIRSVFWLNEHEAENLPVQAPDFWAFRHRVIDFLDRPVSARVITLVEALTPFGWELQDLVRDTGSKIAICEELLDLIPDTWKKAPDLRVELFNMLGGLYWAKGDYAKAINHLKPALEIAQKLENKALQSCCWVGLGMVLQSMKRLPEADTAFQTSQKLDPESAQAWMKLGNIHQDRGHLEDALTAYEKSIALNPKISATWRHLGDLYLHTGKMDDAAHAYQQAVRINPADVFSWERIGDIYNSQGRLNEALPALKMVSSLKVDDADAWINLGMSYRSVGTNSSAIRAFYKAARRAPQDPIPWKNLGDIYSSQEQLRYARKAYKTAIMLDPQDESLLSSLKACYPARKSVGAVLRGDKNPV